MHAFIQRSGTTSLRVRVSPDFFREIMENNVDFYHVDEGEYFRTPLRNAIFYMNAVVEPSCYVRRETDREKKRTTPRATIRLRWHPRIQNRNNTSFVMKERRLQRWEAIRIDHHCRHSSRKVVFTLVAISSSRTELFPTLAPSDSFIVQNSWRKVGPLDQWQGLKWCIRYRNTRIILIPIPVLR